MLVLFAAAIASISPGFVASIPPVGFVSLSPVTRCNIRAHADLLGTRGVDNVRKQTGGVRGRRSSQTHRLAGVSMQTPEVGDVQLLLAAAVSGSDAARYFFAGGICCCISHGLTVPIDVVKTRMQTGSAYLLLFSLKYSISQGWGGWGYPRV